MLTAGHVKPAAPKVTLEVQVGVMMVMLVLQTSRAFWEKVFNSASSHGEKTQENLKLSFECMSTYIHVI